MERPRERGGPRRTLARTIMATVTSLALVAPATLSEAAALHRNWSSEDGGSLRAATEPDPFVRGVYGRDSSNNGRNVIGATGFNAITFHPSRKDLSALRLNQRLDSLLRAGFKALVWLGNFDREACRFQRNRAWIKEAVSSVKGHPAIVAYQVADEPNSARGTCKRVPRRITNRSALVKSIDPSKPTYTVISVYDFKDNFPYRHFEGTTDIMGLDVYPCNNVRPECNFQLIRDAIDAAEEAGVKRYWAVMQDFFTDYYRSPTATELAGQFDEWSRSNMEGYFVYHWEHGQIEDKPDHMSVLRAANARYSPSAP